MLLNELSSATQSSSEGPVSSDSTQGLSNRITGLDVLRGVAILAALFVTIRGFGGFSDNQQTGLITKAQGANYGLFAMVELLFDGKMSALISIVFGASMLLLLSKENVRGKVSIQELFLRRQMWLIVFGLINALIFLWTGDLLFHLGIMGILLFPFIRLSGKGFLIAAIVTTLIYSGKTFWRFADDKKAYNKFLAVTALEKKAQQDSIKKVQAGALASSVKKDTLTKQQKGDKKAWEGLVAGMKYDPKKDDDNNKAMRATSYGKIWNHILGGTKSKEAEWTYQVGIWDFGSMIFFGMALFRFGFFRRSFARNRLLAIGIGALAFGLLLGWYRLHFHHIAVLAYTKFVSKQLIPYDLFFPFERAFTAIGYASLILYLVQLSAFSFIKNACADAGRMALTNYLIQSIVCSLFFTGFGMGYFGRLTQYQLYFVALEIIIVQVVFSVLWLKSYHYGPAEWLLRRLMYTHSLPLQKGKAATQPIIPVLQ